MDSQTKLQVLIPRAEIEATVKRLASEVTRDYGAKNPLLLGILKGSFMSLADLARQLDFPLEVEFIRLSSYGKGQETSGRVKVVPGLRLNVKGRHVLVIEDIIDTGITLSFLMEYLKNEKLASLRLCTLMDKPTRRRTPEKIEINYLGMTVPDKFLVGYGLDCDEKYRNLPDICVLE
jgi:hypoxanthine phosphoribosyltransferase